jgi:hypothetical protein
MAKKKGLLTFLTGLAMGAAAVFFSEEKNRKMVAGEAKKAARKAQAAQRKVVSRAKKAVRKGTAAARKAARRVRS